MQRISTWDVAPAARLGFLHDFIASYIAGLRIEPDDVPDFQFAITALPLGGGVTIGGAAYSPMRGGRTRELMSDGHDHYLLTIHDTDHELEVDGRTITVPAGDMTILSEAQSSAFRLPGTRLKLLRLDRQRVCAAAPSLAATPFRHVPATTRGAALLAGYVDLLQASQPKDAAATVAASHLFDLVGLVFGVGADMEVAQRRGGLSAARLDLVKAEIVRRLTDPDLDIETIARRQGITPRYVQRLFSEAGLTFTGFVRDRRLDLACRRLEGSRADSASIATIAFDAGFGDLSSFNRAFRARFGTTPSDMRAAALRRRQ